VDNDYVNKLVFAIATSVEVILITLKFMKSITVFEKFAKIVYLYKSVFWEIWRFTILFMIFIIMFTVLNYIIGKEMQTTAGSTTGCSTFWCFFLITWRNSMTDVHTPSSLYGVEGIELMQNRTY